MDDVSRRHWDEVKGIMAHDDIERLIIKSCGGMTKKEQSLQEKNIKSVWEGLQPFIAILKSPRMKSFLWRGAMMLIAGGLEIFVEGLGDLQVRGTSVVLLGLIFGEVSKYLNNKYGKIKNA